MKDNLPHWLYDQFGHLRDGMKSSPKSRQSGRVRADGRSQGNYWSRDMELHQVKIPTYIMTAAQYFTHHTDLMRHERGAPPKGYQTHTTAGFIRGCVAAVTYVACLLGRRPAGDREWLLHDPDATLVERDEVGLDQFYKSTESLFGDVLGDIERLAASMPANDPAPVLPSFFDHSLSELSETEWRKADESQTPRPVRIYDCHFPNHVMQYLMYTYRVKWGTLDAFIARVLMHFYQQTKDREAEVKRYLDRNSHLDRAKLHGKTVEFLKGKDKIDYDKL